MESALLEGMPHVPLLLLARILAPALLVALLGACNPTYSPPIASLHYGTPGRFAPGEGEVGVAFDAYLVGALRVGVPVDTEVAVEAGVDASIGALADGDDSAWVIGHGGVRITPIRPRGGRNGLTLDVEFGFGGGAGGAGGDSLVVTDPMNPESTSTARRPWHDIPAYGGYIGVGLGGIVVDQLGIFFRARWQLSKADTIPVTLWHTHLVGVEWLPGPVGVWLSGGVSGYTNTADDTVGPMFELGFSVPFPVF